MFALACLSAYTEASKRIWSPYTWMREKEDRHLATSIKDFFHVLKEGEEDEEDELITKLDGNKVRMLNDTLVSDYITVNYWMWEPV